MKKIFFIAVLIFTLSFVLKLILFGHVPNSVSLQEIEILKFFRFFPDHNDFSFRLINYFIGSSISMLLFLLIYKKTKNIKLGFFAGLAMQIFPWFFVISNFLNYYLIPILFILVLALVVPKNTYQFLASVIFLALFRILVISQDLTSININSFIPHIVKMFDFRTIFFQGDPVSPMLKIPLTGYFFYVDLVIFFSGVNYLFFVNKKQDLKELANKLLLVGLIFFLILPSNLLMTVRGELIFLWVTLIVIFGYYYTFSILKGFLKYLFILLIAANIIFTGELYLNHFDKKNSPDWSYAEQSAFKQLIDKKDYSIYMTNQSDKLYRYLIFYKFNDKNLNEVSIDEMKKLCFKPQVICIAKEEELSYFNKIKDDSKLKFGNYDGLPIYFVLSN